MAKLYDQFGREIAPLKKPDAREIMVAKIADRWSTYPSEGLTPQNLASIFKLADQGDILRQAELFEEMEEKDAHLFSVLQTRKNAVLGLDWDVLPYSDEKKDVDIAAFCNDILSNLEDFDDLLKDLLDAIGKGFALSEIVWDASSGQAVPKKFEWIHQKKITFANSMIPRLFGENYDGEDIPPWKAIYHRYKARSGYDTRAGILRTCAWMYLFKNYGIKDWVIFAEVCGMPIRLGKYEPGAGPDDKEALLNAVSSIGTDAAGIISKNTEIEFVESVSGGTRVNIYDQLASFCDRQMSKAFVGHTGSAESTPGKLGAEHAAREVRQDLIEADCEALAGPALRRQLLRPVVGFNYGWDAPIPWFDFKYEPPEDLKELSEVYLNLSKMNYPLTEEHVSERFKVPLPEKGQTILQPMGTAMTMADRRQRTTAKNNSGRPSAVDGQDEIDRMVEDATSEAVPFFRDFIRHVEGAAAGAGSLADLRITLPSLYDMLPAGALTEHVARQLLEADRIGAESVLEELTAGERPQTAKYGQRSMVIGQQSFGQAQWGPGLPFEEAIEYFRDQAFTIGGIAKAELLSEVKDELIRAMEQGLTLRDFQAALPEIFERHGYSALNPWRISTIYRTNLQNAYQVARYRQMTDPAVLEARPYWRYVAVNDMSTRPEHAAMHGKVYRADHPFWQSWYPPNGFNCRCKVQNLSERELIREKWSVETEDPTGRLFEPVDLEGNKLPARPLMPDKGWDHLPGRRNLTALLAEKKNRLSSNLLSEKQWIKSLDDKTRETFNEWFFSGADIRALQAGKIERIANPKWVRQKAEIIETALNRAEPFKGRVYRGIAVTQKSVLNKILKSESIELECLTSGTAEKKIANRFAGNKGKEGFPFGARLEIRNNKTGVSVAKLAKTTSGYDEAEVILRKGAKYKIVQTINEGPHYGLKELWRIILEEI